MVDYNMWAPIFVCNQTSTLLLGFTGFDSGWPQWWFADQNTFF